MKILTGLVTAVRIKDVARHLIEQSGKPVEIVYTGLREFDVRREHPLISHMPVTALPATEVRHHPLEVSASQVRRTFERWVEMDAEPVPASSPRPLPVAFIAQRLSPGPVGVSGITSQMVEE